MKKLWLIPCLIFATFICCSDAVKPDDGAAVKTAQAFHAAFDGKDLDALTAMCDEEMYWYTLNGRALSRDEIPAFFRPMFANWKRLRTALSDFQVRRAGPLAVVRYHSVIRIESMNGESELKNLHTLTLVKKAGVWKIWQHHMSTP